jgi:hypothetical protein
VKDLGVIERDSEVLFEYRVIKRLKGQPLEVQRAILEERIEELWKALEKKLQEEAVRRVEAVTEERWQRAEAVNLLRQELEAAALGGFRIRGWGAFAIMIGVVMVTVASVL